MSSYSTVSERLRESLLIAFCPPLFSSAWIALLSVQGVCDRDQDCSISRRSLLDFYQVSRYFVLSKYCSIVRLYVVPRFRALSGFLNNFFRCMEAVSYTLPRCCYAP